MGKLRTALQAAVKLLEQSNSKGDKLADAMRSAATNVNQFSQFAGAGVDGLFLFAKAAAKKLKVEYDEVLFMTIRDLEDDHKEVKDFVKEIDGARDNAVKYSQIWVDKAGELRGVVADLNRLAGDVKEIEVMIEAKAKKAAKDKAYKAKYDVYVDALGDLQKKLKTKLNALENEVLAFAPPGAKKLIALYDLTESSTLEDIKKKTSRSMQASLEEAEGARKSGDAGAKKFRNVNIAAELKSLNEMVKSADE